MTKIKDVITYLETIAPLAHQESYDNSGLLTGDKFDNVTGIIICLDSTEEVVQEAIDTNCNLIIAHHPIIFSGLKKITGKNYVERTIIKAIKNNISIYAIHTNLDNIVSGVNFQFAKRLGLINLTILKSKPNTLNKLVCFVPSAVKQEILQTMYDAGAGHIGNYSECSFTVHGEGSFTPNQAANPTIGTQGRPEKVAETRIEILVPNNLTNAVIQALKTAHPYEEVAYYISSLDNLNQELGAGIIGNFKKEYSIPEFLHHLKSTMNLEVIKYTKSYAGTIKSIAICGGSGSFLLPAALGEKVDAYVSADFKYHEYFDAENKLLICDIGHYESEVSTKDLLYDILSKKFSSFALNLSKIDTNPINYFK